MLAFLYSLNLKIKVHTVVIYVYFDSKYDVKCKFASTFIQLVTIINLFLFEVVQKCQHYQLCVLRENSISTFVAVQTFYRCRQSSYTFILIR